MRHQELAIERRSVVQVYVKPNGTQLVSAFTLKYFIWYNDDSMSLALKEVLYTTYQ